MAARPTADNPVTYRMPRAAVDSTTGWQDIVSGLWPLIALLMLPAEPPGAIPVAHVRGVTVETQMLIADTMHRSAIVRDLVARLACSDSIVYVEITASPQIPTARTKLVAAAGATRFLRIGINARVSGGDLAAYLAHELQHAVEIAEHEEVRDESGVRQLHLEIGRATGANSFETEAAKDIEIAVRQELRHRIGG
jgi:hypothetical protein